MQWVSALARQGHSGAATGNFLDSQRFNLLKDNDSNPLSAAYQERRFVFSQLRDPDAPWTTGDMPLTVTRFQYDRMRRWSLGDFVEDWQGPPRQPAARRSLQTMRGHIRSGTIWRENAAAYLGL
jgi:hypothetical protein